MNHDQIREKIFGLHDAELDAAEKSQLEKHLKACGECRGLSEQWQQIRLSLAGASAPTPSENFVTSVMNKIEDLEAPVEFAQGWRLPDWLFPTLGYGVAIALMFVVVNQPLSFAETTEAVLLSDVPDTTQWAFSGETSQPAPLMSAEEELL